MNVPEMQGRRSFTDEDGSVLLLMLGGFVVMLIAVVAVTDASVLFLHRGAVAATADAAALAGAQSLDLATLYTTGDVVALDPGQARAAVRTAVADGDYRPEPRVEGIDVRDGTVSVTLSAPIRLPFAGLLGAGPVRVSARSSALLRK